MLVAWEVLKFAVGPIGRWLVLAVIVCGITAYGVHKIRSDAVAEAGARATEDANNRLQNAIRNGDAVNSNPSKLRQPGDRDCGNC